MAGRFASGITRVADLTGLDVIGIPVWSAVRPAAWSLSQSQGKGLTHEQARISARMEALEGAFAENAERLAICTGTAIALSAQGKALLPLDQFMRCTDPERARETVYDWLPARGLATGASVLVPLPAVSLDFRVSSEPRLAHFRLSSVGLGAHGDRTAAIRHGLLEAVEEDAFSLAHLWPGILDGHPPPALQPDDAEIALLTEHLARAGLRTVLQDITSDLGLPTVLCHLVETNPRRKPFGGIACRLTLDHAARDAMLEAIQSRLTDISGAREDIEPDDYTPQNHPSEGTDRAPVNSIARPALPGTPSGDIALILSRFSEQALPEPVVVDLDRPGDGVACVSVLCPGLETGGDASYRRAGKRAKARLIRHMLGLA